LAASSPGNVSSSTFILSRKVRNIEKSASAHSTCEHGEAGHGTSEHFEAAGEGSELVETPDRESACFETELGEDWRGSD
jgi:hypothetical protein